MVQTYGSNLEMILSVYFWIGQECKKIEQGINEGERKGKDKTSQSVSQ